MQTSDVREAAQGAVTQSKSYVSRQIDERSTQVGEQMGSVASDLRNVGRQLGESDVVSPVAGYVDQGADLVERLGIYLKEADTERLIVDLEAVARRQPWMIAAGALVLGFAASRFIKTSSTRRYRASDGSYSATGYRGGTYGRDLGGASSGYAT